VNFDADDFMYMNLAERPHRCWVECRAFCQRDKRGMELAARSAERGRPVYAYFKEHGYVGLGLVDGECRMASERVVNGTRLFDLPLVPSSSRENSGNPSTCEWVVPVCWYRTRLATAYSAARDLSPARPGNVEDVARELRAQVTGAATICSCQSRS
jgi:hypothetical protein